jgi:uncharacterized membrane protein YhhN
MFLLIASIAFSAVAYIVSDYANKAVAKYVFKPLSTILVIFLATQQSPEVSESYKYLIISGLLLSLLGDVFLMLPNDKFIWGLLSFLLAHLIFIYALADGMGPYFEVYSLIPAAFYAIVFLWILLPKTAGLKIPVLVYSLVLMTFLWQAIGRFYYSAESSAWYSLLGALLFVVSDSLLAIARFVKKSKYSIALIHITYWSALIYIALSI